MAKCKECGAELVEGDLFCGECGAKVESQVEDDVSGDSEEDSADEVEDSSDEVEDSADEVEQESGASDGEKSNHSDLITLNIMSFVLLFATLLLFKHGWNKIGTIVSLLALFFGLVNIGANDKKSRVLMFITMFIWAAASVYLALTGHTVISYLCLLPLGCITIGMSIIKKGLAFIPLIATGALAAALFIWL